MDKSLRGAKILLTRQLEQCASLNAQIASLGGISINVPMFAIESTLDQNKIWQIQRGLSLTSMAVFVSSNAAKLLLSHLSLDSNLLCACVGPATAEYLLTAGCKQVIFPQTKPYDSVNLIKQMQLNNLNLANRYIMVFTGENGNRLIVEELQSLGAVVEVIEVYKRVMPKLSEQEVAELTQLPLIDMALVTCVTSLINLKTLASTLRVLWQNIPLLVVSRRIRDHALGLGFSKVYTASSMTDADIISALIEWHSVNQQV